MCSAYINLWCSVCDSIMELVSMCLFRCEVIGFHVTRLCLGFILYLRIIFDNIHFYMDLGEFLGCELVLT